MSKEDYDRLTSQGLELETVGDLIGGHAGPAVPVTPPRHDDQPAFPAPGIYFGMPEATYHAIHAGSTSGLKRLSTSSMDYWAYSALNREAEAEPRKDYFDFGKAIHCFLLEGEEVYAERYVVGLEKPKDALENVEQIKTRIAELGMKPTTTGFDDVTRKAKKEDWIAQLLALDPEAVIWDKMQADFNAEHEGAEIVTHKIDKRVRIAVRMIEAHPDPQLHSAFKNGYGEVSVFWHCAVTGCPMKARFDYLKLDRLIDLKSFGNKGSKPIDRAIEMTIASYRYNLQHVIYDEAAEAAKAMIRERGEHAIFSDVNTPGLLAPEARGVIVDWCLKWAKQDAPITFLFVFQQTGLAPVTRGKIMPRESMGVFGATKRRAEELKRVFVANCEVYGTDPWLDIQPVSEIDDENIPLWATEI